MSREKRIEKFCQYYSHFRPAVFQNYFHTNYADSYSWYLARNHFTRATAIYSMMGYIMGLGDRHAENILLFPSTGQSVHVDFNCLFNKGECFQVPECVPFRLTHNMTTAMGVFGAEGTFRATCEDVLLLLRQYRELFQFQVGTFSVDILNEWASNVGEKMDTVGGKKFRFLRFSMFPSSLAGGKVCLQRGSSPVWLLIPIGQEDAPRFGPLCPRPSGHSDQGGDGREQFGCNVPWLGGVHLMLSKSAEINESTNKHEPMNSPLCSRTNLISNLSIFVQNKPFSNYKTHEIHESKHIKHSPPSSTSPFFCVPLIKFCDIHTLIRE